MSINSPNYILHLYRQLLRASAKYPSKNRLKMYEGIREEFRENVQIDSQKAKRKLDDAYHGLQRLRQFDKTALTSGGTSPNDWSVDLGKNVPSWFKPKHAPGL